MDDITAARSFYNADDAAEVLPAWFVPTMMEEGGLYGVMLTSGHILAVERIERLHQSVDGTLWLDVVLFPRPTYASGRQSPLMYAPMGAGQSATINCRHVVSAFEIGQGGEASAWAGAGMQTGGTISR